MHWTYVECTRESNLSQGDILEPTAELKKVLADVHPYFDDDRYLAFMVATQSCDLVRDRGGAVTARHILLLSVRPLASALARAMGPPVAPRVYTKKQQQVGRSFMDKLLDQNDKSYFYLHQDAELGLGTPAVAALRVGVSLREEHYEMLTRARRGALEPEFRAKFGWLIGNLYARAATTDWADMPNGKNLKKEQINAQLDTAAFEWVDPKPVERALKANEELETMDHSTLLETLERYKPEAPIEALTREVIGLAKKHGELNSEQVSKLRRHVLANRAIKNLLRS